MIARAALAAMALGGTVLAAQQAAVPRAFDVVSIKANHSAHAETTFRGSPGGRFEWTNVTLGTMIQAAYQRFNYDEREIVGAPGWATEDRFDIIAQLGGPTPPVDADGLPSQLLALLRGMLEDRFHLVTHWEQRERPAYALTRVRENAPLGPNLKPVDASCTSAMTNLTTGQPIAVRPGRGPDCRFGAGPGRLQGNAVTIAMMARVLGSWELHRPVVDRTGLTGSFDIDLRYRPDVALSPDGPPPPSDQPSIFTAVQEQLGLTLVADRAPVDVLVVDRAERPTAD